MPLSSVGGDQNQGVDGTGKRKRTTRTSVRRVGNDLGKDTGASLNLPQAQSAYRKQKGRLGLTTGPCAKIAKSGMGGSKVRGTCL